MTTSKRDQTHPLGPKARAVVQTTIEVREAPNGSCSILDVVTTDRPGLLVDIVSVLKDINVNVVSAEIDTIGDEARDEFFVTYHGEPLNGPMVQLVTNSLQVRRLGVCWRVAC
jgi:UTP:GlnB (protein PII) uridylyltransferase